MSKFVCKVEQRGKVKRRGNLLLHHPVHHHSQAPREALNLQAAHDLIIETRGVTSLDASVRGTLYF